MNVDRQDLELETGGGPMRAFLCRPTPEDGQRLPAAVVVHDIYGLSDYSRDVACSLASEGYVAIVPDLFWQIGSPPSFSDREAFMRFRQSMDDRQLLTSLDVAVEALRERSFVDGDHIGVVGFCMGGYYALLETVRNRHIAACADFYGGPLVAREENEHRPVAPMEAARDLRVPFLGLFGAEDQGIPVEQVEQLEEVVRGTGVPHEFKVYPGAGHAFHSPGQRYVEVAAKDAWQRTLDFFDRHLKRAVVAAS